MVNVSFSYELPYVFQADRAGPLLRLEIGNVLNPSLAIETLAHLDTGTDITVFRGDVCAAIGIELMTGREKRLQSSIVGAGPLVARVHRTRVIHEVLGAHELEVAFATGEIARNLLGLDFFNLFKIGFEDRANRMLFEPE
jgi:hypothetical protein